MKKMLMKAVTMDTYALYKKDGNIHGYFRVSDPDKRREIDRLQGTEIDFDKDIPQDISSFFIEGLIPGLIEDESWTKAKHSKK